MKLIDRFIGRELLVNVLFAIAVLSLVLVVGNIFRKLLPLLVNHDVPLQYLLTFIAYVLPFSLIFTIPWGLLTAILLVFGRLSADNELIALRANGVSVTRICVPLAALALVCTAICLWLNVDVAPAAQEKLRSSIFDLATSNPIALFGGDQVIDQFPGRKIYVGKKEGNKLENIIVFQMDEHSLPVRVTHARTGMLEADLENKRLLLHLYNARYEERDEKNPYDLRRIRDGISMAEGTLPISLEELYEKEKKRPSRSALSLSELLEQLKSGNRKDTERDAHRDQQALLVSLFLPRLRADRRAVRHHHSSARNFGRFRHRTAGGDLLLPLHHHRRHSAREREDPPGAARLVPERALSRDRRRACSGG